MAKWLWAYNEKVLDFGGGVYASIPDPSLSIQPSAYNFPFAGGTTQQFTATPTLGVSWHIDSKPSWMTYGYDNLGFDASCDANNTGSARTGTITIHSDQIGIGTIFAIDVSQPYTAGSMSVSPNSYTFDGNGESKQFSVTSNVPWDVSTQPAWISTYSKVGQTGNGSFYAYASQNLSGYRSGNIVMKCTSYPNLYPAGYTISVDQPMGRTLTVEYSSSTVYYTVWDSAYGWNCSPNQYANTLYFNVIVTGSPNSWYCQFEPNNGTFYAYPTSYSGSYSNMYSYFGTYQSDDCDLVFYWSDDNSEAFRINYSANDYNCP